MITKEKFASTMRWLTDINDRMNAVDVAMKKLDRDFCGFYIVDVVEMIVDLMTDAMNDKDSWVAYFVYECNYLKDANGKVLINGEPAILFTWEQVYDFILSKQDDNK